MHPTIQTEFLLHLPGLFFSHHVESLHEDVLHVGVDLREVVVRVEDLHRHLGEDQGHVLRLLEVGHLGRVLAQRLQDRFLTSVKNKEWIESFSPFSLNSFHLNQLKEQNESK
jgi:hypothetical protein